MFTPLQKILPASIGKIGIRRESEAALICEKYRKLAPGIVHKEVLAHTHPQYYLNGTLTINVENSAWAHVVTNAKTELLLKMNASLGRPNAVKNIRTQVADGVI